VGNWGTTLRVWMHAGDENLGRPPDDLDWDEELDMARK
jgi:hypothetical protein